MLSMRLTKKLATEAIRSTGSLAATRRSTAASSASGATTCSTKPQRSAVADSKAVADNEQLEYLGDAVLGMLVSEYLVRTFPHWSEGQLSKSRARLVNAASLCAAAKRLGLGEHMLLGRGEE